MTQLVANPSRLTSAGSCVLGPCSLPTWPPERPRGQIPVPPGLQGPRAKLPGRRLAAPRGQEARRGPRARALPGVRGVPAAPRRCGAPLTSPPARCQVRVPLASAAVPGGRWLRRRSSGRAAPPRIPSQPRHRRAAPAGSRPLPPGPPSAGSTATPAAPGGRGLQRGLPRPR